MTEMYVMRLGEIKRVQLLETEFELSEKEDLYLEPWKGESFSGSIRMRMSAKDKKLWGKVFMMPKYRVTEWAFPRKKKRGSMRRARKERRT